VQRARADSAAPRLQTARRASVPPAPLATSDIAALVSTYERYVLEQHKKCARIDGRISAEAKAVFVRYHLSELIKLCASWPYDRRAVVLFELDGVTLDECQTLALMCGFGSSKLLAPQRGIAYNQPLLVDAVSAAATAAAAAAETPLQQQQRQQ
jgi:hypothetical protein